MSVGGGVYGSVQISITKMYDPTLLALPEGGGIQFRNTWMDVFRYKPVFRRPELEACK